MSKYLKPQYIVASLDEESNKYINMSPVYDQESEALTSMRGRARLNPEMPHIMFKSVKVIHQPEPAPVIQDI